MLPIWCQTLLCHPVYSVLVPRSGGPVFGNVVVMHSPPLTQTKYVLYPRNGGPGHGIVTIVSFLPLSQVYDVHIATLDKHGTGHGPCLAQMLNIYMAIFTDVRHGTVGVVRAQLQAKAHYVFMTIHNCHRVGSCCSLASSSLCTGT